jgi:hypothetical protein
MPIVTAEMKRLAEAEIKNPQGAYDKISPGDDHYHPLQWILNSPTTPPFFAELAERAFAEVRNPTGRYGNNHHEVAHLLGEDSSMPQYRPNPRPARDQGLPQPQGGSNYNQDPNDPDNGSAAPITGSDCLQFVQLCLARLSGSDKEDFLTGLADIVSTTDGNAVGDQGLPKNNTGALDRRRSVRRTTRDGSAHRPAAMDSAITALNSASFNRRFPFVNVTQNPFGRR